MIDKYLAYLNVRISELDLLAVSEDKASKRRKAYVQKCELILAKQKYLETKGNA